MSVLEIELFIRDKFHCLNIIVHLHGISCVNFKNEKLWKQLLLNSFTLAFTIAYIILSIYGYKSSLEVQYINKNAWTKIEDFISNLIAMNSIILKIVYYYFRRNYMEKLLLEIGRLLYKFAKYTDIKQLLNGKRAILKISVFLLLFLFDVIIFSLLEVPYSLVYYFSYSISYYVNYVEQILLSELCLAIKFCYSKINDNLLKCLTELLRSDLRNSSNMKHNLEDHIQEFSRISRFSKDLNNFYSMSIILSTLVYVSSVVNNLHYFIVLLNKGPYSRDFIIYSILANYWIIVYLVVLAVTINNWTSIAKEVCTKFHLRYFKASNT